MGRKIHRTLADLIGDRQWLYAECRACKHTAKLDPRALQHACYRSNLSPLLELLAQHFRCSECGAKRVYLGPCYPPGSVN